MVRRSILIVALLFGSLAVDLIADEVDPALQAQAIAISQAVLSPFCPGRALSECPSGQATALKHEIYQMLKDGSSPEQIKDYLYQTYGEDIKAVPGTGGFDLMAWLGPILFLILGAAVLIFWIMRQRSNSATE